MGLLLSLAATILLQAGAPAGDHLRAGAGAFRKGDFQSAFVEFKVAEAQGRREARWYAAATLVKLDRSEEALEAFALAEQLAPGFRDPLFDYYEALACYAQRLYGRADDLLASVGDRAGPRIGAQVGKVRAELVGVLSRDATPRNVDWYQARAAALRKAGRHALARSFLLEARRLASHRSDCYGCSEIGKALAELPPAPAAGGPRR